MFNAFMGIFLLLYLAMGGFCLTLEATEYELHTLFSAKELAALFSIVTISKKNYYALSRLFDSEEFNFNLYHRVPATSEELKFVTENYNELPKHYMASITRLQKTKHGIDWVLRNLDKLANTNLELYLIKPNCFTLEQQRIILTFALEHQRPFMSEDDFCKTFPDSSVFDHEWLWLYLDPSCFYSLPKERHPQVIEILQRKAKEKDAGPAATLFLILVEAPIDWKEVNIEQPEVKKFLQSYEQAYKDEKHHGELWELYKVSLLHLENFPLGGHSVSLLHALIFIASCSKGGQLRDYANLTELTNTYLPRDLSCHLVKKICKELIKQNKDWNLKLKLPRIWNDEILKSHLKHNIFSHHLPSNSQLKEWRRETMELTEGRPSRFKLNTNLIYSNGVIERTLAIDHFTNKINQLINGEYLQLSPTLKFACDTSSTKPLVSEFWEAKIYQSAISRVPLPLLDEMFKEALFMDPVEIGTYKRDFSDLAAAICLNPTKASFKDIKVSIISTKKVLDRFNLGFYYDPRESATIFE